MPHANAEAFSKADSLGVLSNRNRRLKVEKRSSQSSRAPAAETVIEAPDVEQLRRARTEFYGKPPDRRRSSSGRKMAHISESRARQASPREASRNSSAGTGHETQHKQHGRHRHRRRRANETEEGGSTVYVYRYAGDERLRGDGERPKATAGLRDLPSTTASPIHREGRSTNSDLRRLGRQDHLRRRHTSLDDAARRRSIHHEEQRAVTGKNHERLLGRSTTRKRHSERAAKPVDRPVSSMRERPSPPARPSLQRSSTTIRTKTRPLPDLPPPTPSIRSKTEDMSTSTKETGRGSRIVYSLFGIPSVVPSEQRVQCLTCLSDDIPSSKSAKLSCSHHMCHDCLKRIFTMSVTDPQHMPPRCCTQDHIPLKHVDRLFDTKFKMKWNKKYQEYTTKNRIYCPAKGCSEWIKPSNIHIDLTSGVHPKKYGKCGRCKLKVCCKCNGRWHPGRDCPKDEETKKFAEIAKKEGWQRCFNCSAMVELKEGCNHMTCRCTAEFCMICGLKWKTCDCPWFNYEAVENDRLNHMNIPQARRVQQDAGRNVPPAYHEELRRRRDQERRDEVLARRLQVLGLDDEDDDDEDDEDDHLARGPGGVLEIGNAAGHFLNQDFVRRATNILGRNFGQADNAANHLVAEHRNNVDTETPERRNRQMSHAYSPVRVRLDGVLPTLAPLRQHSTASRLYNNAPQTRISERVVPRRTATDYTTEAAHHRPDVEGGLAERERPIHDRRRHSAMAGLTANTEEGRIGTWLDHVEDDPVDTRRVIPVR